MAGYLLAKAPSEKAILGDLGGTKLLKKIMDSFQPLERFIPMVGKVELLDIGQTL